MTTTTSTAHPLRLVMGAITAGRDPEAVLAEIGSDYDPAADARQRHAAYQAELLAARRSILSACQVPVKYLDVDRQPPAHPYRDPNRPRVDPEHVFGSVWCVLLTGVVGAGKTVEATWLLWCALVHAYRTRTVDGAELSECLLDRIATPTVVDGELLDRPTPALAADLARWCRPSELVKAAWDDREHGRQPWPYRVPVLVLDDLGRGTGDGAWKAIDDVLCTRHDHQRFTVATTNLPLAAIAEKSEAVASRLADGLVLEIQGHDRRLRGGRR